MVITMTTVMDKDNDSDSDNDRQILEIPSFH